MKYIIFNKKYNVIALLNIIGEIIYFNALDVMFFCYIMNNIIIFINIAYFE